MIKVGVWDSKALAGDWEVTFKIDGVRMLRDGEGNPVSRRGKPLYNLNNIPKEYEDCEVFVKDLGTSVSAVRTIKGVEVEEEHVYSLFPSLDPRLFFKHAVNPTSEDIQGYLAHALQEGYEGIVMRQGEYTLKVKPKETYDVPVISIQEGKGRNEGRMGALVTPMGKVGTGFTDLQREEMKDLKLGTIIEVECMLVTEAGKFRHARFIRIRWDK